MRALAPHHTAGYAGRAFLTRPAAVAIPWIFQETSVWRGWADEGIGPCNARSNRILLAKIAAGTIWFRRRRLFRGFLVLANLRNVFIQLFHLILINFIQERNQSGLILAAGREQLQAVAGFAEQAAKRDILAQRALQIEHVALRAFEVHVAFTLVDDFAERFDFFDVLQFHGSKPPCYFLDIS